MVSRRELFGFLAAAAGIVLLAVGMSFVPDVEAQFFGVRFVNDTDDVVLLSLCDDDCGEIHESREIPPGQAADDEISDKSVMTSWLVRRKSGELLGCITRSYDHKVPNLRIRVSAAKPC